MKKVIFVLIMALLFGMTTIMGMAKKPDNLSMDSSKLKLIEPVNQNLQINCTNINRKIYFIDDISLTKNDIQNNKVCFFLNSDFVFSEIKLGDGQLALREYKQISPKNLIPAIDSLTLLHVRSKCKLYEFVFEDVSKLPDLVNIQLKYHIKDSSALKVIKTENNVLSIGGTSFWYPRNYLRDERLSLTVKTTDKIAFSINGKAVEYEIPQSFTKVYRKELLDLKSEPAMIIFVHKS